MKFILLAVLLVGSLSSFAQVANVKDDIMQQISFDPKLKSKLFSADAETLVEFAVAFPADMKKLLAKGYNLSRIQAKVTKDTEAGDVITFKLFATKAKSHGPLSGPIGKVEFKILTVEQERTCSRAADAGCSIQKRSLGISTKTLEYMDVIVGDEIL